MAEGARLESEYTGQTVSRVRTPFSPPNKKTSEAGFFIWEKGFESLDVYEVGFDKIGRIADFE